MGVQMVEAKINAESVADVQAAAKKCSWPSIQRSPKESATPRVCCPTARRLSRFCRSKTVQKIHSRVSPEFREFLEGVDGSRAEPAANIQPLTVIGSYRLF